MLIFIIISLSIFVLFLPLKHAFGVNLAASFLFIAPNNVDVTTFLFIALFLRLVVFKIISKQKVELDSFTILFIFLLFFSIISYAIFQGEAGVQYLRRFFMTILILFLFVNIFNSLNDLKLLVNYFLAGTLLLSLHIFTQTLIPINPIADTVFVEGEGRFLPRGFANQSINPNNMGSLLVWGFGFVVGFYNLFYFKYIKLYIQNQKLKLTIWGIVFFINISFLIGILGSRANLIVLILVGLISMLRLNITRRIARITIVSVLFLFLIGPIISSSVRQMDRLPPTNIFAPLVNRLITSSDEFEDSNDYSRTNLANQGFTIFLQNPILGVGIGNESIVMEEIAGLRLVSHNTYVSLLSELGLVGLFFLAAIIGIWAPYIKDDFTINILLMIGAYATFHNITLMTTPWLIMSFSKKCYDLIGSQKH